MHTSVFLAALGEGANNLHPAVRRYVAGPSTQGLIGVGEGRFEIAGSRLGRLNHLLRPFVGARLLVTRYERDVPFTVVNRPTASPDGQELHAERSFRFRSGTQTFVDVLAHAPAPNTLQNLLGASRRIELELRCWVSGEGHLRLSSRRVWIRACGVRIRLPPMLSVRAEVEDGYDESTERQTVSVTVMSPVMGTVLEYRGTFTYRFEPA